MTMQELKVYLVGKRIHPEAVSIGSGLPYETEKYCLVKEGQLWEVYYSERGTKGSLMQFRSEDEACRYLIKLLEQDQSVWLP